MRSNRETLRRETRFWAVALVLILLWVVLA